METFFVKWERNNNGGGLYIKANTYEEALEVLRKEEKNREDNPPGLFPSSELE